MAFDLLPPAPTCARCGRGCSRRTSSGFYDERPGEKRLYAVSAERRLTPANQLVLSHELRHALQDQYVDLHGMLPDSVGDFDDRRLAFLSLLEGDATLVMERFLLAARGGGRRQGGRRMDVSGWSLPAAPRARRAARRPRPARAALLRGPRFRHGRPGEAGRLDRPGSAWARPPRSTEQVLHPEKYVAGEEPRAVDLAPPAPPGGRLVDEGVLGEVLLRTLLGEGGEAAAAGWGGGGARVVDVSGRTLRVWRSVWDAPEDGAEFLAAARRRMARLSAGARSREGCSVFSRGEWRFDLGTRAVGWSSRADSAALFEAALRHAGRAEAAPFGVSGSRRTCPS